MKVGILALQGAFREHKWALEALGVDTCLVVKPDDIQACEALVIPGGESTTIGRLLDVFGLKEPLLQRTQAGMPLLGTCAGMILLAKEIEGSAQTRLGLLDVTVRRNAFGRQVESFEADLDIPVLGEDSFPGVFIRAPYITRIGPEAEVLCRWENKVVLVRQGRVLAAAFHPELTGDRRLHEFFLTLAGE
ncbi:MAG: pyridoxal 5'-phosphate synthase glutaminase subunit PdxT [Bacillota bacterium]